MFPSCFDSFCYLGLLNVILVDNLTRVRVMSSQKIATQNLQFAAGGVLRGVFCAERRAAADYYVRGRRRDYGDAAVGGGEGGAAGAGADEPGEVRRAVRADDRVRRGEGIAVRHEELERGEIF